MKSIISKMVVMSVALVLLCVSAMAQNTKILSNDNQANLPSPTSYGVMLATESVELFPKGCVLVEITIEEGYYHPFILYRDFNDDYLNADTWVVCECFKARIVNLWDICYVEINANEHVKEEKTETIYVRAMKQHNEGTRDFFGVPLTVTVRPANSQNKI